MRASQRYLIQDASAVGEARRGGLELARQLGLDEVRGAEVGIVVTELASNIVKHAGQGELLLRPHEQPEAGLAGAGLAGPDLTEPGLEVLALDRGPGIERPGEVLRDGYSTAGTSGTGLGAAQRLAAHFDLYSLWGQGTAVLAVLRGQPGSQDRVVLDGDTGFDGGPGFAGGPGFDLGVVQVPYPGESVCGDGWSAHARGGRLSLMLVDGLGHGLGAHDAARAAVSAFEGHAAASPSELLGALHAGMRGTRGGVAAVAALDVARGSVAFSGMGNISAAVVSEGKRRGLVSQNGTLGLSTPMGQEFSQPWTPESALVMHSDGISSLWDLGRYPGLARRRAALIAGVLYRDGARGRDDASVLVVKQVNRAKQVNRER